MRCSEWLEWIGWTPAGVTDEELYGDRDCRCAFSGASRNSRKDISAITIAVEFSICNSSGCPSDPSKPLAATKSSSPQTLASEWIERTTRLSTWLCFLDRSIISSKPIARESLGNEFNFVAVKGLNGLDGTVVNLKPVATAPNGIMDTVDFCTQDQRLV